MRVLGQAKLAACPGAGKKGAITCAQRTKDHERAVEAEQRTGNQEQKALAEKEEAAAEAARGGCFVCPYVCGCCVCSPACDTPL